MNAQVDIFITEVHLVLPNTIIDNGWLLLQDGRIAAFGASAEQHPILREGTRRLDGNGGYVVPGFIDIHVHGGAGFDFMTANEEELQAITRFHMENGTTAMLATTVTASREDLNEVLERVTKYTSKPMPYAQLLGVHLEGPFVNPKWKGAQNEAHMVVPQSQWLKEWVESYPGVIQMQTLAPELDGAASYISLLKENGIVAACGHTDATFDEIQHAVEHGLTHAVHTFNAMRALHHREPGTVGAVMLNSEITGEVIADGQHVHPAAIKLLLQVKGTDRVVLVTDAISAAGMPDGDYELGSLPVIVEQGIARLKDGGSLAGSTLTMIKGFHYLIHEVGLSITEASHIASLNPAGVLGISNEYGSIEAGKRADVLLLDRELNLHSVVIDGVEIV